MVIEMENDRKNMLEAMRRSKGFRSYIRGVVVSEDNLKSAKRAGRFLFGCGTKDLRVKYRGPRIGTGGRHTMKRDATHFDMYYGPRRTN
jgi:hypothetical protein